MNLLRFGSTSKKKTEKAQPPVETSLNEKNGPSKKDQCFVLNHCRCCGTVVKIPEGVPKFKCSVCKSTVTLLEENLGIEELPVTNHEVLSYKSIRQKIRYCERASAKHADNENSNTHMIYKPLEGYLYRCFSSFFTLNNSFKLRDTNEISHHSPNLSFKEINDSFEMITSLPTKRPYLKVLTAASELLKRPKHCLSTAGELKWLLILFEIPTLIGCLYHNKRTISKLDTPEIKSLSYDLIKRIVGYISSSDNTTLKVVSAWFSNYSDEHSTNKVELVNLYITFQLTRLINQNYTGCSKTQLSPADLPSPIYSEYNDSSKLNSSFRNSSRTCTRASVGAGSSTQSFFSVGGGPFLNLPAAIHNSFTSWGERSGVLSSVDGVSASSKSADNEKPFTFRLRISHYGEDWHIKTAARVLSIFYYSNRDILPVYAFYNSLVDYINVKQDFEIWQNMFRIPETLKQNDSNRLILDIAGLANGRNPKLTICEFPFLLSLGAKISILEYEAKRTMERKAEEAFIKALDKKRITDVHLRIKVRRNYISNDSLRCLKEHRNDLKKALKVEFIGEQGVDVGGLKKEWFSLLTKELFSQENGMFFYNEESHLCWFSGMSIERNFELYHMVGSVLGLAIYNSTILDLRFPLALYKKLLNKKLSINDYIELFPTTGKGLLNLLTTKDDVTEYGIFFETTFKDLFGNPVTSALIKNGSKIQVNNLNRHEYVSKWIDFYMNKSIKDQFQSFYNGFHTVIGGNALSLFSPKEIEMIICGDSESRLDCESFKSITKYNGWKSSENAKESNIVRWYWEWFEKLNNRGQNKLLQFVTGSDRVPATGIHTMQFKITRMPYYGSSLAMKLPVAHTCFNELCIYEYSSKEEMLKKLDWAINESKGFGLR